MDNFKCNFLLPGHLKSLSLNKFFSPLFKILTCYEDFLVTLFLPLLLECSAEIILKVFYKSLLFYFASFAERFCFREEIILLYQ